MERLSAALARRIALAAQGLADARTGGAAGRRAMDGLVERLGVVQIDSVNVLVRTHYLPAFSRLGPYDRTLLEDAAWGRGRRSLFEYWGHEASFLPVRRQPLFRWRMDRARAGETWNGLARFARERRDYIDAVLVRIEREGPLTGGDLAEGRGRTGWWTWSDGKRALEWLFWAGLVTTRTRRGFERVYDLPERVLPREILNAPTPIEDDAHRSLIAIAGRAMGVATEGDLRDYFRMPSAGFRSRLAEVVEAGDLIPVDVEGWDRSAYLAAGARRPRRAEATALLSPFDNLIWRRERALRLFGARIRLEIYTPAERRTHGYYVLPFLLGDRIVARLDLKADRPCGTLLIQSAHLEPGASPIETVGPLALELRRLAGWLGLSSLAAGPRGDLAAPLARAVREGEPPDA